MSTAEHLIENTWDNIELGRYRTPDDARGRPFTVEVVTDNNVIIHTNGGTPIRINRAAFIATIRFLLDHQHGENAPCPIGANKNINLAGPLCLVSRQANDNTRMISSYLLPILQRMGLVGIYGGWPANTAWLTASIS